MRFFFSPLSLILTPPLLLFPFPTGSPPPILSILTPSFVIMIIIRCFTFSLDVERIESVFRCVQEAQRGSHS